MIDLRKFGTPAFTGAPKRLRLICLEVEPGANLSLEGNSQWLGEPSRSEEVDWFSKIGFTGYVLKRITEVAGIEYVEGFKENAELFVLAKIEELRDAHIQL